MANRSEVTVGSTKQNYMENYKNILKKGRIPSIMTQTFNPVFPTVKNKYQSPDDLKSTVLGTQRIKKYIDEVSKFIF